MSDPEAQGPGSRGWLSCPQDLDHQMGLWGPTSWLHGAAPGAKHPVPPTTWWGPWSYGEGPPWTE